jgi:hypothetical protein
MNLAGSPSTVAARSAARGRRRRHRVRSHTRKHRARTATLPRDRPQHAGQATNAQITHLINDQ